MPVTQYVARFPGPFAALVQATTLGGLRLEALPAVRVRDVYWDTPEADLLGAGLALRVRATDGERLATLRPVRATDPGPAAEARLPPGDTLTVPPGPLAEALVALVGRTASWVPLVTLRQFRTPRVAYDGTRAVALVTLDVVVSETGAEAARVSNEAEIDLTRDGGPADHIRLDPALRGHGLEPTVRSKFERAVLARPPGARLVLLPDEREALDQLAAHASPTVQARAQAVQFGARGLSPQAIAARTGTPAAVVAEVLARFADQRLAAVADVTTALSPRSGVPLRPYRISEIVAGAGDAPVQPVATRPARSARRAGDAAEADGLGDGRRDSHGDGLSAVLDPLAPAPSLTPRLDRPADASGAHDESSQADRRPASDDDTAPVLSAPWAGDTLPADTPLVAAAAAVIASSVSALDRAAAHLAARPSARTAMHLLASLHHVRLALDAFPLVPAATALRLTAALRPLATGLGRALDADRASWLGTDREAALLADRDRALADVLGHLSGPVHRAAMARARRLVARLDDQAEAGVLVADDAPLPLDDWTAGPAPLPTRLEHARGQMLWRRVEAVFAFEGDTAAPADAAETAGALAAAIGGLRFVLGLVAAAAPDAARAAEDVLAASAARLAEARNRAVAHGLAGVAAPPGDDLRGTLHAEWTRVVGPDMCRRLATVVVGDASG